MKKQKENIIETDFVQAYAEKKGISASEAYQIFKRNFMTRDEVADMAGELLSQIMKHNLEYFLRELNNEIEKRAISSPP